MSEHYKPSGEGWRMSSEFEAPRPSSSIQCWRHDDRGIALTVGYFDLPNGRRRHHLALAREDGTLLGGAPTRDDVDFALEAVGLKGMPGLTESAGGVGGDRSMHFFLDEEASAEVVGSGVTLLEPDSRHEPGTLLVEIGVTEDRSKLVAQVTLPSGRDYTGIADITNGHEQADKAIENLYESLAKCGYINGDQAEECIKLSKARYRQIAAPELLN